MKKLTPEGQRVVAALAERHGFSEDAVTHMLAAVAAGHGSLAQFQHPEFGGGGQWMRGGMLMLGDMFNHALKGRVDALCTEIAEIIGRDPELVHGGRFQSQSQSSGKMVPDQGAASGSSSLFVADPAVTWWPGELGQPSATGSQNHVRYAYFAGARRLAVNVGGHVRVYDTLDHRIGGVSQQQSGSGTIQFTSQHGPVDVHALPLVSDHGHAPASAPDRDAAAASNAEDAFAAIERLGKLRDGGLITEEEFAEKKAELLRRI